MLIRLSHDQEGEQNEGKKQVDHGHAGYRLTAMIIAGCSARRELIKQLSSIDWLNDPGPGSGHRQAPWMHGRRISGAGAV
jgi:hypothetical protein